MGLLGDLGVKLRGAIGLGDSGADPPMPPDPYSNPDVAGLVTHIEDEYTRRIKERRDSELRWMLNLAFIDGNQYVDINPVSMTMDEIGPKFDYEQREVFNHIAPNIETRIARLTKARPILKARPGSNEPSDIRKTKVSTKVMQNIYSDQDLRPKLHNGVTWLESCGTVIFKNYWDPTEGDVISLPQMQADPNSGQQAQVGTEQSQEGDLGVLVCPPQEILPDSCYHQDIKDCRRIMHQRAYHVDEIYEVWGVRVDPEENVAAKLQRSMMGKGLHSSDTHAGGASGSNSMMKDFAIVKEEWERPSEGFPEGRLIVVANKKLLHFSPLPYRCDKDGKLGLPFTKVVDILRPGVFWGDTVTRRLIPLQKRYNALRNKKAEYLAMCAIGMWLVEENSTDIEELENNAGTPGWICTYKKGTLNPPRRAENQVLPAAFESEQYSLLQEFSILSGVSELSRQSKAPTGVKSGVAMSLALEQDDTRLSTVAGNIEIFLIENGSMWLRFYKQYVKTPRLLRSIGRNNIVDVLEWQASDLKAEDVIIDSFSSLSETPAQKRQMVFDLLGAGLLVDPDTGRMDRVMRNRVFEMLQVFDWESGDDDTEAHVSKAERENRILSEGGDVVPADFDDHTIHIAKHSIYRTSAEYEDLVGQNPKIGEFFTAHCEMHLNTLTQQAQAQREEARKDAIGASETIAYKDLPAEAQVQMLAKLGIGVTVEQIHEAKILQAKIDRLEKKPFPGEGANAKAEPAAAKSESPKATPKQEAE